MTHDLKIGFRMNAVDLGQCRGRVYKLGSMSVDRQCVGNVRR
jgi:hypothetical protein